jgi:hypothetical protein
MFHYIDDIISINNSKLGDFGDRIYPIGFEIKDITDTAMHLSYLDLHHECQLRTKVYARRDDFNFSHLIICSNIPAAPAYGGSYHDISSRRSQLARKLLNYGYLVGKLKTLRSSP